MHMHEQWQLHCTSQWGHLMPLSEHVYCVAISFKMTEQVEAWICIKFCVKLEHSSVETSQMIQKAFDDHAMSSAQKKSVAQTFQRLLMKFRKIRWGSWWWFQSKILQSVLNGARDAGTRDVRSQGAYFGTEASLPYVQCFLYLLSSSVKVSIFHITWLDTLWKDLIYSWNQL